MFQSANIYIPKIQLSDKTISITYPITFAYSGTSHGKGTVDKLLRGKKGLKKCGHSCILKL
jgi:hypothetical protein